MLNTSNYLGLLDCPSSRRAAVRFQFLPPPARTGFRIAGTIASTNCCPDPPQTHRPRNTVEGHDRRGERQAAPSGSLGCSSNSTNLVSVTPSCAARPLAWRRIRSFRLSVAFIASLSYRSIWLGHIACATGMGTYAVIPPCSSRDSPSSSMQIPQSVGRRADATCRLPRSSIQRIPDSRRRQWDIRSSGRTAAETPIRTNRTSLATTTFAKRSVLTITSI